MKAPERIYLTPQYISAVYPGIKPEADHIEYLRSDLSSDKERETAVEFHHWTRKNNFYQTEDSDEWFAITGDGVAFTTDELFTEYLKTLSNEQARD